VFEVLDLPVEVADPVVAPTEDVQALCAAGRGDVVFDNVWFSYSKQPGGAPLEDSVAGLRTTQRMWSRDMTATGRIITDADRASAAKKAMGDGDGREWALQNISLRIPAGSMCAIVGRSGAGKTTLLSLLPRLYDTTLGQVSIAGMDVRSLLLSQLASTVGAVPQDVVLLNDSLAVNLRVARPDASDADLEDACAKAHILDFVRSLPQGFETVVGERGLRLSGGERQRIAIARVILRAPYVLLLDEATSSLDSVSEKVIQEALAVLMRDRTSIVIAHRLSTILAADLIVVLDNGHVVETGTHASLLALGGKYAELYHTQFRQQLQSAGEVTAAAAAAAAAAMGAGASPVSGPSGRFV
jgi:ATP-binding cassette subfamily B protein